MNQQSHQGGRIGEEEWEAEMDEYPETPDGSCRKKTCPVN